jgi:hypothetical protein
MEDAALNNAKKAVRGLAADLQDFHEQGQRSSAAQLMQQGSKMAEVLLDIATNASIRGMRVDGVDLFSVLDFIAYVCPGLSSCNVKQTWHRLENACENEVVTKCHHLKFNGKGQRNTPCMTILGLQKLLLILGSKAAVEFRDRVVECFNRVLAGDHTLIREINANAAQNGPVQQIARVALAEQAVEDRIESVGCMELEFTRKRKTDDYKLELAERRMELTERQMTIKQQKMTFQMTLEQQKMTLQKEKMTLEKEKITLEQQKMTLPLCIQKQNLELTERWIDRMQQVNPDWRADARLQQQAQDRLCSAFIEQRLAITAGPAQDAAPLAISDVVASLKHKVPGKLPRDFECAVGKIAKSLYVKKHGKEPGQHQAYVNGSMEPVYSYTEADRPLLEQAFWLANNKNSPPLAPFLIVTRSKQVV